jgi:hypothetical protein
MLVPALAAAQPGPDGPPPAPAPPPPAPSTYAPPADGPPGTYGGGAPWQTPVRLAPRPQAMTARSGDYKDPSTAGWMSLLVTGGGFGLMLVANKLDSNGSSSNNGAGLVGTVGAIAFFAGPTTGHTYAGHTWNTGLGIRLASTASAVIGIGMLIQCIDGCSSSQSDNAAFGSVLLVGGMIGYGIGTVYEIGTAPGAARDANHEHGLDMQLSLAPVRGLHGNAQPGIGLAGHF